MHQNPLYVGVPAHFENWPRPYVILMATMLSNSRVISVHRSELLSPYNSFVGNSIQLKSQILGYISFPP
jgi:hypothetical protein